jgi:hypothetical protein
VPHRLEIKHRKSIEVKENKVYHLEVQSEWSAIHSNDLWIYNKLFLSRRLGYLCGPAGVPVPNPDFYIVRPSINLLGMSRLARIEWIESDTEYLHPSEFWCEIFEGDHISVDYYNKKSSLVVIGERNKEDPLYKWKKWIKIDRKVDFPLILDELVGDYEWINCEFIGNRIIEVHFRRNPDFRYQNNVAIPIWNDCNEDIDGRYQFIEDSDYKRKGFLIE